MIVRSVLLAAWAAWSAAGPAAAQSRAAEICPWCKNDPEIMQAAGVISHGPFPLVRGSTADLYKLEKKPKTRWIFLETAHIRWASSLPEERLDARDLQRLAGELAELRRIFPELPERLTKLDPWLRLHFQALRAERFYARFQKLLGVSDADFPEARGPDGPFMGDGRYLGEKEKFEIVLHERVWSHQDFTELTNGMRMEDAVRWHCKEPHKMVASLPCEHSDLRQDRWLHPHVVHILAHMMFCAYKHFSYDPPLWLDEGLAHVMEREADPQSWTREADEGTTVDREGPSQWLGKDAALARRGKATSLAVLLSRNAVSELSEDDHITMWSKVRFLVEQHPENFARFLGGVKGQLDSRGYPSGADLPGLQRRLLHELWGWSPQDLDTAWEAWVLGE